MLYFYVWFMCFAVCADDAQPDLPRDEQIQAGASLIGIPFTESERKLMQEDLKEMVDQLQELRHLTYDNSLSPALIFNPFPEGKPPSIKVADPIFAQPLLNRPEDDEDLAFLPVSHLATLIRTGKLTSEELTRVYLDRLERYGPKLECVISLLKDSALERAKAMDAEIAAGKYRGPLHGIPYGAKDLFAVKGTRTTWGAAPYKDQVIDDTATVIKRLDDAGAVLLVKLTLGALAWGDHWYGGFTRNPWNLEMGSSGSSAGSASATSAGLVAFSLGTETYGSIVSPATRCGVTGLRPTYGRVSRAGAMALSWSMDKIGPICRSVEDTALVFEAIRGTDGRDHATWDAPFPYQSGADLAGIRIGYLPEAFKGDDKANDRAVLDVLRKQGVKLIPVKLPEMPINAMTLILTVEAGAAFQQLVLSNQDDQLKRQIRNAWPNVFRAAQFVPATSYVQANRARTALIKAMAAEMEKVDVFVAPSFGPVLPLTNLTGHPCAVLPNGFNKEGQPTSISFIGSLFGEAELLAVASVYQSATDFHLQRPQAYKSN